MAVYVLSKLSKPCVQALAAIKCCVSTHVRLRAECGNWSWLSGTCEATFLVSCCQVYPLHHIPLFQCPHRADITRSLIHTVIHTRPWRWGPLTQYGLQQQPVLLAAQLLTPSPVFVDEGDCVSTVVPGSWHSSPTFVLRERLWTGVKEVLTALSLFNFLTPSGQSYWFNCDQAL